MDFEQKTPYSEKWFSKNFDKRSREVIFSVLNGRSILDKGYLNFKNDDEIIKFLYLNEFDITQERDMRRIDFIFKNALSYLREVHTVFIPRYFDKKNIIQIFLDASTPEIGRDSRLACSILKVMNIINHIDSQDLISHTPIQHQILVEKVKNKVLNHIDLMRNLNYPDFQFQWSVKERNSVISKFLTKNDGIVARIFDRIRFRIVTNKREDIIPILNYFFTYLFPYNYLIPNQTKNSLLNINKKGEFKSFSSLLKDIEISNTDNVFSGPSYKILNFVVDIPVSLDDIFILPDSGSFSNYAYFIFMLVEVQIVDKKTAENNEIGENSHRLYKLRQKKSILKRVDPSLYEEVYGRS